MTRKHVYPRPARKAALAVCTALLATTSATAIGDRENSDPVGWSWHHNQTAAQINTIRSKGYRIVSLDVESTSPMKFSAAFVRNTGSHARSGRTWYYGTSSYIVSKLPGRRMTSLASYVINGQVHFAASMIANTGTQKKLWWYYAGTATSVWNSIVTFKGRILDLDTYVINGQRFFSALVIKNEGSEKRGWWWYRNATTSFIRNRLLVNKARLTDITKVGTSTFDCVMIQDQGQAPKSWWYNDLTATDVSNLAGQNGARVISVQRTPRLVGGSRFQVAMINNSNALTTRIGNLLRATGGRAGGYLKEVGGSVRASLLHDEVFEPAATLNVLHHVHAMKKVEDKKISLSTPIKSWQGNKDACPSTSSIFKFESLNTVLFHMMKNYDHYRTMSVDLGFGRTNINSTATALGMTNSRIRHRLGCFGPPASELTLLDAGRLHEAVATGYLGKSKAQFYNLMVNGNYNALIDQEAAKIGLAANIRASFKAHVMRVYTVGSYDISNRYFRSAFGWFRLPFCVGNKIVLRQYVSGVFVKDGGNKTQLNNLWTAWNEMSRDEIRAALTTWQNSATLGSLTTFGTGCNGSNGVVQHFAIGKPEINHTVSYSLKNGPKLSFAILELGVSTQNWGALQLPFDLTPLNAPGCKVYVSWLFGLGGATSGLGGMAVPIPLPNSKSLVGKSFFTQYACIDPAANQLGLTLSNGITTKIGGVGK